MTCAHIKSVLWVSVLHTEPVYTRWSQRIQICMCVHTYMYSTSYYTLYSTYMCEHVHILYTSVTCHTMSLTLISPSLLSSWDCKLSFSFRILSLSSFSFAASSLAALSSVSNFLCFFSRSSFLDCWFSRMSCRSFISEACLVSFFLSWLRVRRKSSISPSCSKT